VQQRLHVFDCRGVGERPDATGFAVIAHHVVAPARAVLEHEHLPAAFRSQIEQRIAGTPEKTGEIEIARLESNPTTARNADLRPRVVAYN
jgi:hypothetical protein